MRRLFLIILTMSVAAACEPSAFNDGQGTRASNYSGSRAGTR